MCQKRFNFSTIEDNRIKRMFWRIYEKYRPLNCPSPCSKMTVETQLMYEDSFPTPTLDLIFDPEVEVNQSSFTVTVERLLADLGGSVSGGRTLLWLILSSLLALRTLVTLTSCAWRRPRATK